MAMCEPTKLKFDLPIGTWGTTEVEVEYPWHRDLDSIILPLLETAHGAQQERQKEQKELRKREASRDDHASEDRVSELKPNGECRNAPPAERDRGTIPAANAAKITMSNSRRKKGKEKAMSPRPNEEVRVCLKGVETIKWMTMMRGDYFHNLLEAYARECEPPKETARLKLFWKGKWVKSMETPDDLCLDADAKLEVYELVHTRRKAATDALEVPYSHQRNRSGSSVQTIQSIASEERRPISTVPTVNAPETAILHRPNSEPSEHGRKRVPNDELRGEEANVDKLGFAKSSGSQIQVEDQPGHLPTVFPPGELRTAAQLATRRDSHHTNPTRACTASGSLAAEYQAKCVATPALRPETAAKAREESVVKLPVQPPSEASLHKAARLHVPVASKLQRHFGISDGVSQRSESLCHQVLPYTTPLPSMTPMPSITPTTNSGAVPPFATAAPLLYPPCIPSLVAPTSRGDSGDPRDSVQGCPYAKHMPRRGSFVLHAAEIETTIEAPGGRRVSSTFRTSWP